MSEWVCVCVCVCSCCCFFFLPRLNKEHNQVWLRSVQASTKQTQRRRRRRNKIDFPLFFFLFFFFSVLHTHTRHDTCTPRLWCGGLVLFEPPPPSPQSQCFCCAVHFKEGRRWSLAAVWAEPRPPAIKVIIPLLSLSVSCSQTTRCTISYYTCIMYQRPPFVRSFVSCFLFFSLLPFLSWLSVYRPPPPPPPSTHIALLIKQGRGSSSSSSFCNCSEKETFCQLVHECIGARLRMSSRLLIPRSFEEEGPLRPSLFLSFQDNKKKADRVVKSWGQWAGQGLISM